MAKRGRPAKVRTEAKTTDPVKNVFIRDASGILREIVEKPVLPLPPPVTLMSEKQKEAQVNNFAKMIQHKHDIIRSQMNVGEVGFTSLGDLSFGEPLDGLTPAAIQQLKDMGKSIPKIAAAFEAAERPAPSPQIILPVSYSQPSPPATAQPQTVETQTVDVMDIFGLK